jgi:hypothetical protein
MARGKKLDAFTSAYIEAALWSTNDNADEQGGEPLDANYGVEDIAPETLELMIEDCADFQERFGELILDEQDSARFNQYGRWEIAGHDFWLNREGHGSGFWDGGWPKHGDELSEAAQSYGGFELYVGDDGLIYGPPPDMYRNPPEWLAKRHPSLARKRTTGEPRMYVVTGALSPNAELVHTGAQRGIQYEVYRDPTPEQASGRHGSDIRSKRPMGHRKGMEFAAVVLTPYQKEDGSTGVEREQIGYGRTIKQASEKAADYIARLWHQEQRFRREDVRRGRHVPSESTRGRRHHRRHLGRTTRESTRQHVARDFSSLPALAKHERDENGASHILVSVQGVWFFYPGGSREEFGARRRAYTIGQAWEERGYWHSSAPSARTEGELSPTAEPLDRFIDEAYRGKVAFESPHHRRSPRHGQHAVHDYIAVGTNGRKVAGPFKDYSDAKSAADRAGGYVQFATEERRSRRVAARKSPRGGSTRRISSRAPQMTPDAVMKIARDLSGRVGGSQPKTIPGGHRWSDKNESAYFVTYSPEYNQVVVVLVSVFQDGTLALDFFSSENRSELDRYENIVHFLYSTVDLGEMVADLKWVWETVDGYAESWGADRDRADVDESRRAGPPALPPAPTPLLLPPAPTTTARRPPTRSASTRRRARAR